VQHDRLQHAWGDAKINPAPAVGLMHRRAELDVDGKLATVVEAQDIMVSRHAQVNFRIWVDGRERDGSRQQIECSSARIIHSRRCGQSKRRAVIGKIAREFEILQRDRAFRRVLRSRNPPGPKQKRRQ
jgi:hypothetical protein